MEEVKLACTSSDESEAQEVRTQVDSLPDLYKQIHQLLCTRLSDHSFMVRQEELRLMQRSSFYLEIRRHDLSLTADEQQHTPHVPDSMLWTRIDKRRLQSAMALANTRVELLLTLLGLLNEEIIEGCRQLEAFISRYDQGSADGDTAAHVQQRLLKTRQDLNDFESRMTRSPCPLHLRYQLIPENRGPSPRIPLSASLAIKWPTEKTVEQLINRMKSHMTSNIMHLHWVVADMQSEDLNQEFEIQVKSLHPTTAEHEDVTTSTCRSYSVQVNDLIPNTCYEFSVRRVETVNLVYGPWIDTIVLATLGVSK